MLVGDVPYLAELSPIYTSLGDFSEGHGDIYDVFLLHARCIARLLAHMSLVLCCPTHAPASLTDLVAG